MVKLNHNKFKPFTNSAHFQVEDAFRVSEWSDCAAVLDSVFRLVISYFILVFEFPIS